MSRCRFEVRAYLYIALVCARGLEKIGSFPHTDNFAIFERYWQRHMSAQQQQFFLYSYQVDEKGRDFER